MIDSPATCKIIQLREYKNKLSQKSIYRIVILNKSCFSKEQCRIVAGRQACWRAGEEGRGRTGRHILIKCLLYSSVKPELKMASFLEKLKLVFCIHHSLSPPTRCDQSMWPVNCIEKSAAQSGHTVLSWLMS